MTTLFTIEKLSGLEGTWRVDWFGDVDYPDRQARSSQPSVAVQFSCHSGFGVHDRRQIWLPVGLLPMLKIGDLWERGSPTGKNTAPEKGEITNLLINDDTVQYCKAGSKHYPTATGIRSAFYCLPLSEHPWHLDHTQTNCLFIKWQGKQQIIIPCMELIRFYFGSSSSLLSALLRPDFNIKSLIRFYHHNPNGSLFLQLAEGISGASAADIGRIVLSCPAKTAAMSIIKSVLRYASVGKKIYPKCKFPFEGVTNLNVTGQWLSNCGPDPIFLVYQILSCSYPFPFKTIRYQSSVNTNRFQGSASTTQANKAQRKKPHEDTSAMSLVDGDPDEKRQGRHLHYSAAKNRFPDLENKSIYRNPTLQMATKAPTPPVPPSGYSVGATGNGKGITPVDVTSGIEEPPFDTQLLPSFVKAGVASLHDALSFSLMTPDHHNDQTFPVPFIYEQADKPYAACFIEDQQGERRRRLACCLQVDYVDRVEGAVILETASADSPEVITFELAEEFLDIELMKKHLHAHMTKQVSIMNDRFRRLTDEEIASMRKEMQEAGEWAKEQLRQDKKPA